MYNYSSLFFEVKEGSFFTVSTFTSDTFRLLSKLLNAIILLHPVVFLTFMDLREQTREMCWRWNQRNITVSYFLKTVLACSLVVHYTTIHEESPNHGLKYLQKYKEISPVPSQ